MSNKITRTLTWAVGLLVAISLQTSVAYAGTDADLEIQIEQGLNLGANEAGDAGATTAEFEQQLRERFPECLALYEGMDADQREEVVDIYRDSGSLPGIATVIRAMSGPVD